MYFYIIFLGGVIPHISNLMGGPRGSMCNTVCVERRGES